ncbi:hypothetical protein C8A05DRAFT_39641 [Staphylotrichum tortipilum]|uniref:Ysc84 actin-binding domain-containing protein n=1 Tax=Staphylotrichum tortipilum TaxID=2831512 RepID=A0AAN6RNB6_9PEZI|nr:hypothetical protein C8A05DRAFT_39641 [Staphylotrichum longicolle]
MHRVSALLPAWDRSRQQQHQAASSSAPGRTPATTTPPQTATASTSPTIPKTPSAPGPLGKVFGWAAGRAAAPAPLALAPTRYGRETYWPTTLDKECDKAARIIKSFCFDGFLSQETPEHAGHSRSPSSATTTTDGGLPPLPPRSPKYITKKIPPRIIQNAVGLAVFSCMRSGLWMSGSGGAGLITARKADGTWSPPSAIILHTAELAFVLGVDIYDCVLVINSVQTLEVFTRPKIALGADVSLAVGPLLVPGGPDPEIRWKDISETVLTYVKARGKHQAAQLEGSLVTERANENATFYGADVSILDILAGNVPKNVPEMRPLFEVIKAAEGRSDYDKALMDWLALQPAPGDADIESPRESIASPTKQAFGVPDANDPDPFGVIGLEMAGIEIREAGTKLRPESSQFEFHPSPMSPVFGRFSRQSMDTFVSRSNRGSCMSARTQATAVTDACTQTDVGTADTTYSRANSDDGKDAVERLPTVVEPEEVDYTKVDMSIIERLRRRTIELPAPEPAPAVIEAKEAKAAIEPPAATTQEKPAVVDQAAGPDSPRHVPLTAETEPESERDEDADDEDEDEDDEDDEPIICEVAMAQPARTSIQRSQVTQVIQAKGAIVTIPKRIPPPLPARSPARASRGSRSEYGDVSSLRSPVRTSFLSFESRVADDLASPASESPSIEEAMDRSASPRHVKNSSVSTTATAQTETEPAPSPTTSTTPSPIPGNEPEIENVKSPIPPTPRTSDPVSSAEDESEREPTTPRTAETDFDTASEAPTREKGKGEGVRVMSASPVAVGGGFEREGEREVVVPA